MTPGSPLACQPGHGPERLIRGASGALSGGRGGNTPRDARIVPPAKRPRPAGAPRRA